MKCLSTCIQDRVDRKRRSEGNIQGMVTSHVFGKNALAGYLVGKCPSVVRNKSWFKHVDAKNNYDAFLSLRSCSFFCPRSVI